MKKTHLGLLLSISCFSLLATPSAFSESTEKPAATVAVKELKQAQTHDAKESKHAAPHWAYSGSEGPEHWGDLSPQFTSCKTGENQSPVDIPPEGNTSLVDANLEPIDFNYNMLTPSTIVNNGHTVQVNMWSGGEISVDGVKFKLKQFHFHTPSENRVAGHSFPLEAHFVHQSEDGQLAVVAILFVPGPEDPTIANLWKELPMNAGEENKLSNYVLKPLQFEDKLKNYYRYNGSLTTPPCTEGVRWIIMKKPYHVSREQVEKLQKALKQPNNRPIHPLNARVIVE